MVVKVRKIFPDAKLPERASDGAVGYDVYSYHVLDKWTRGHRGDLPAEILPGESILIGIGVQFAIPFPHDCQVRPRSGLASRYEIELSNSPGTVDPDYRGDVSVLLRNRGAKPFVVEKGMRIAQLVFTRVEIPELVESETLPATIRDTGGFGSTGLHDVAEGDSEYRRRIAKLDRYFLGITVSTADLSDCLRGAEKDGNGVYRRDSQGRYCGQTRRFGCIVVKNGNIVAIGHNSRTIECSEEAGCIREREAIATGMHNERGCIHAEEAAVQNFLRTGGVSLEGATIYANAEPCLKCAKLLARSGAHAVVVPENVYPTNGLSFLDAYGIEIRKVSS